MNKPDRKMLNVISGQSYAEPPVWLMRQAGRYLPEYRKTREKAGGFLDLCFNPELAIEVTLQPIRRFGFDASILFSDILVIPKALGRRVDFLEGEGPNLDPLEAREISNLTQRDVVEFLDPVLQTVSGLRLELPAETTLIGFCGAPWTVATYMIAGRGTPDQAPARLFALQDPENFQKLMDVLVDASADYLIAQFRAGADCVQIFDSWAGVLGEEEFQRWCVAPVAKIVEKVRSAIPDAPIIGFPKGAGFQYFGYRESTGVNMIGLDWSVPLDRARELQKSGAVQGLLDPQRLIAGGSALDEGIDAILANLSDGPLVFNLGHGITPQTPIAHVEQMLRRIRG